MEVCLAAWNSIFPAVSDYLDRIYDPSNASVEKIDFDETTYNDLTYEAFEKSWIACEQLLKNVQDSNYLYPDEVLQQFFKTNHSLDISSFSLVKSDILSILNSTLSPLGQEYFKPIVRPMEGLLITLLGHNLVEVRDWATVMLNVLYDGHTWQLNAPLPVTIAEVGDDIIIEIPVIKGVNESYLTLFVCCGQWEKNVDDDLVSPRIIISYHLKICPENPQFLVPYVPFPPFSESGFFDWQVINTQSHTVVINGRFIILPTGTHSNQFYEVPVDLELSRRVSPNKPTTSTFRLLQDMVPTLHDKGVTVVALSTSLSHHATSMQLGHTVMESNSDREDSGLRLSYGLNLSSMESSPLEPVDEKERAYSDSWNSRNRDDSGAVELRCSRSQADEGCEEDTETGENSINYGSISELHDVIDELSRSGMKLMIPFNSNRQKNDEILRENIVLFDDNGKMCDHPGTDGRETQWETEVLMNYRLKRVWDDMIERMLLFSREYHITSFYLQDCQSWPIILETDSDSIHQIPTSTLQDVMEGKVVFQNEEGGYWTSCAAKVMEYPNPFLVKISRKIYEIFPNALICGSAYWKRSQQVLSSGIIPCSDDLLSNLCNLNNISLTKSGIIENKNQSIQDQDIIEITSAISQASSHIINSSRYVIQFLCNYNTPYPSMTLNRATWPAVCLLYTLPMMSLCYYMEDEGHSFKITQGDEFSVVSATASKTRSRSMSSESFDKSSLAEDVAVMNLTEGKEQSGSVVSVLLSESELHYSARLGRKLINFHYETSQTISSVFLVGNFNDWDINRDAMILKKTDNGMHIFELYLELYSGLYYYKYYVPSLHLYTWDPFNSNRVDDTFGGYNSVLEIPIVTQVKHPLLQTAQMRADVWWEDENMEIDTDGDISHHYRNVSYDNLGLLSSATSVKALTTQSDPASSIKRVTSWTRISPSSSTERIRQQSPSVTTPSTPSFSLSYTELNKLAQMEGSVRDAIGPQFGFDLNHINDHYAYFRQLRSRFDVLKNGSVFPLHIQPLNAHIISFCRYIKDVFFVVITSFSSEPLNISFSFDELSIPLHNIYGEKKMGGLWSVEMIREQTSYMWNSHEMASRKITHSFLPYDFWLIGLTYCEIVSEEKWSQYVKQRVDDLQMILTTTRPVGQQFYDGKPVWNKRMLKEQSILRELQNNFLYLKICDFCEEVIQCEEKEKEENVVCQMIDWYINICNIGNVNDMKLRNTMIRELLFYSSYQFNASNNKHGFIDTTERNTRILETFHRIAESSDSVHSEMASLLYQNNKLGPIVIVTPELGKWSTVGGLGVMVDNLSKALALQGEEVIVISPYYDRNRYGETDYLKRDGIQYRENLPVRMPNGEVLDVGFHKGVIDNITYVFFHYASIFMRPYPSGSPSFLITCQILMALAPLVFCSSNNISPSIVLTNDWPCGLVATYSRMYFENTSLHESSFFHIVHNLDESYEGRIYYPAGNDLFDVHRIPVQMLCDPYWKSNILNPSRCVMLSTDNWGTVSSTYQHDIEHSSALSPLLRRFPQPFSSPNGVFVYEKKIKYSSLATHTHNTAKLFIQRKYFGMENLSVPLLVFVGRITEQKGVHLICEVAEELIVSRNRNIQIIVGGIANESDPYGRYCINKINHLRHYYGDCFWAQPYEFFTDGFLCNLAADFGLMPSLFEPCGIVQDEFFAAGTPVIAFNTGGLKETVCDWSRGSDKSNGFLYETYNDRDFMNTINRALSVFSNKTELYERLRESTGKTTIEVVNQARDYLSEFYRMRRCLLHNVSTPFIYECMPDKIPSEVLVVADFTDWRNHPCALKKDNNSNRFVGNLDIPAGNYKFKFLVDGLWTVSTKINVFTDENCISNHIISIPSNTNLSVSRVIAQL